MRKSLGKKEKTQNAVSGQIHADNMAEGKAVYDQKAQLQETLTFTNFFLSTYISAYYVNLDTFDWQVYKRTEELEREYPITTGYLDSLMEYIARDVYPDDRAGLRDVVQPQRMRDILRRQPEFNYHFRDISGGRERILKMQVIRGADENHAAFGFVDVTEAIKEQQKQLLGTTPLSPEILSKANIGLWAFELDEGKPPRMYVDETMLGLIGLAEQVSPEATYHAWYDQVDQGSYDLVNDAVGKMAAGEHAEVQYPWHRPDGETMIVRCGGVRNFEYKTGVRIEGTHQDVTEVLHFDEEVRKQKIREIIEPFTADYNLVYRVNLADASFTLLKIDDDIIGNGMEFTDFTAAVSFFTDKVAYDSDRELLRQELDFAVIREKLQTQASYSVEYRAVLGGVAIWHELVISSLGADEVVFAFGIKDEEILSRHISKTLFDNYDGIYVVNLNTDQLKIIKSIGFTKGKSPVMSNSKMLLKLAAGLQGEAKEYFTRLADADYFRQLLQKDGKIEYYYQSPNIEEKPVWLKCEIHVLTMAGGTVETAFVGITRADSVQRERMELGVQLKAALAAVTEEKERFTVVRDLINSAHWSFKIDENDEITDADFFGDVNQVLNYDLKIAPHAWETILHPEDKEKALKAFNAAIADHSGRTPYDVNYRMLDRNGNYNWFRSAGKIIERKDGSREFFGIHVNINSRIEMEQEQTRRRKEAEESQKLIERVASVYSVALLVNMNDDSCRLLRMDGDIKYKYKIEQFRHFREAREHLASIIHAADVQRVLQELDYAVIREKLKTADAYNLEYRVISDKATKWHELNITRINDEEITIGFAEKDLEITKRHLEEKRFAEYFALYEVDLDNAMVKIVIDSPFYKIGKAGTALPYVGTMQSFVASLEGEGREFFSRMADLDFVRRVLANDNKHNFTYRSNNVGNKKWVDCTSIVTYRHADGTPAMFLLCFSYIDSHGAARQELQSRIALQKTQLELQQQQLERALSLAQSANRAKSSFLFNMSHDIRTPMNAITGFTTMAKKYIDDKEKVADYLNKIDTSGKQLLTLVNQVLEMSRIESGKIELDEKPVNVRERFDTMMTVLTEQAEVKGLDFHCGLKDVTHINILADDARATQIALNVGGNAMKYTPEGGRVDFILQEKPCEKEGFARFTFTITDTGIGMSKEFQKVMFEPFTREKSSTVSQIQGTGLGMSIVKKLVELMGGTIEVQSELGKGTRFDITIDFRINECAAATAEVADRPEKPATFGGKRVLLVEDNELNREIAKDILEEFGLIVEEADDGDVALAMVQQAVENGDYDYYKLVLMDIQMPRMSGYDATRAIRALSWPAGSHLPIVAMTANAFEEDRKNAFAAGMDEHLAKPIEIEKLLETLARFL